MGTSRTDRYREICQELNDYTNKNPGLTIDFAVTLAKKRFAETRLSKEDIPHLKYATSALKENDDDALRRSALSVCLLVSLKIMSESFDPFLFLWGKYISNSFRFSHLVVREKADLPKEEFFREMAMAKDFAKSKDWDDMEGLRMIHNYFYDGGWYYFPDEEILPKPIGSTDLNTFQLVNSHFLYSLPHTFLYLELVSLLEGEVLELEYAMDGSDKFDIGFEAADIFIYATHIATILNLDISDVIGQFEGAA